MESSLCEKPERHASRRLSDHLVLEGQKQKVHSLVDKVYSRKNLKLAWERVRANQGAGGTDGVTIGEFEAELDANLERLHRELRERTYRPQAVRRLEIPKRGAPGKTRPLGIPSVYDRVCQQALVNRLEPIFEKVFDPSSFGYRKGRKTADALAKIWREVEAGNEWIVDADLKDYLDVASYYTFRFFERVEEVRSSCRYLNSYAFCPSAIDVNGLKLAALYTLQDGLPRDAE
jgi:RNA-directed DNA polymerase